MQLAAELEKLELADKAEQEAITRDQMQVEDAQKLDDELAAWEEKETQFITHTNAQTNNACSMERWRRAKTNAE